jgi:hypothetical protein
MGLTMSTRYYDLWNLTEGVAAFMSDVPEHEIDEREYSHTSNIQASSSNSNVPRITTLEIDTQSSEKRASERKSTVSNSNAGSPTSPFAGHTASSGKPE